MTPCRRCPGIDPTEEVFAQASAMLSKLEAEAQAKRMAEEQVLRSYHPIEMVESQVHTQARVEREKREAWKRLSDALERALSENNVDDVDDLLSQASSQGFYDGGTERRLLNEIIDEYR